MGPGQRAWGHGSNDVPHFDRDQHFRTQENQQKRRSKKVNEDFLSRGDTRSALANFIFVGSIISIGLFVPSYLFEKFGRGVDGVDKMRRSERK
jgi:fucose permease